MDKKIIQKAGKYFTETEKHQIIQEMLTKQCTKQEIWEKYTGEEEEHGQLLRWMKALVYNTGIKTRRPNIEAIKRCRTQSHCLFYNGRYCRKRV